MTVRDVVQLLESWAPPALALEGDPVGLQVGSLNARCARVMVALDPSLAVIEQAVAARCDLLVTHHELLYRPMACIDRDTARGRAVALALSEGLTVYAMHTNWDIAEGGVNDVLAERLGLADVQVLDVTKREELYKLVVFVPDSHHQAVLEAVCAAGAGHIGGYSHCTFNIAGEGTFQPLPGSQPFIGRVGALERVRETRLETIVPESRLDGVVRAMKRVHPYEEVAYDVYPLKLSGRPQGIGRVGNLPAPMPLLAFARHVQQALGTAGVRFGGDPQLTVRRVAVLGGSGRSWVGHALRAGAQVLVTADCSHHDVADAWEAGLAVVDATHAALERPAMERLARRLQEALQGQIEVRLAEGPEDPFQWVSRTG
ncbi:MAG: Nif3-like dinuclear metal center hexameric protein [Alicyclobacillaceae bacterium]|nr:Nif3-like dinuclear metal center hexameric protein [Alicyclobacillaceae bacterium]